MLASASVFATGLVCWTSTSDHAPSCTGRQIKPFKKEKRRPGASAVSVQIFLVTGGPAPVGLTARTLALAQNILEGVHHGRRLP